MLTLEPEKGILMTGSAMARITKGLEQAIDAAGKGEMRAFKFLEVLHATGLDVVLLAFPQPRLVREGEPAPQPPAQQEGLMLGG